MNDLDEQEFPNSFPEDTLHDSFDGDVGELIDFDTTGFGEPVVANGNNGMTLKRNQKIKAPPQPPLEHKVKKKATQSVAKAKNDSLKNRPKRALSAYNLFFQHERKQMVKVGFANMAKNVGSKWKVISPQERAHFDALAAKDKWRYNTEMGMWTMARQAEKARMAQALATTDALAHTTEAPSSAARCHVFEGIMTPLQGNSGNYERNEVGIDDGDDFAPINPTSVRSHSCTGQQQHQHPRQEQYMADDSVLAFEDYNDDANNNIMGNINYNMSSNLNLTPTFTRDFNSGHNACNGMMETSSTPLAATSNNFFTKMPTTSRYPGNAPTVSGHQICHQSQYHHHPSSDAAGNMQTVKMQQQQQQQQILRRSYSMPSDAAENIMFNNMNSDSMNNHGLHTNGLNNNFNNNSSLSSSSYQNSSSSTRNNNMVFPTPLRSQSARISLAVSSGSHNNSSSVNNSSRGQFGHLLNRLDNDSVDYLVNTFCRP